MPSFRGIYKEIQIMDIFFWKYQEISFEWNDYLVAFVTYYLVKVIHSIEK